MSNETDDATEPDTSDGIEPAQDVNGLAKRDQEILDGFRRSNLGNGFKTVIPKDLGMGFVPKNLVPKDLGLGFVQKDLVASIIKSTGIMEAAKKMARMTAPISVKVPEPFVPLAPLLPDYSAASRAMSSHILSIDPATMAPNRAAVAAEQTAEYTGDLLNAMRESLKLNEAVRQENAELAAFTRRVSVLNIVGIFGSLALGAATVVIAIIALSHP
jgi:hypothetical protein